MSMQVLVSDKPLHPTRGAGRGLEGRGRCRHALTSQPARPRQAQPLCAPAALPAHSNDTASPCHLPQQFATPHQCSCRPRPPPCTGPPPPPRWRGTACSDSSASSAPPARAPLPGPAAARSLRGFVSGCVPGFVSRPCRPLGPLGPPRLQSLDRPQAPSPGLWQPRYPGPTPASPPGKTCRLQLIHGEQRQRGQGADDAVDPGIHRGVVLPVHVAPGREPRAARALQLRVDGLAAPTEVGVRPARRGEESEGWRCGMGDAWRKTWKHRPRTPGPQQAQLRGLTRRRGRRRKRARRQRRRVRARSASRKSPWPRRAARRRPA